MATPKKLYPVEGRIDLSSCRLCWSKGIQDIAKTCSEKSIVIFWISCNKFMEMFFREIKHSLNWSVVFVKEKLKTQQLLRKQSLKRNGYSWRKKGERRGVSSYRRQPPHLNQRIAQKFPRERGLTFEACAAASSSQSQVSVFMVILLYISTRCSCFV